MIHPRQSCSSIRCDLQTTSNYSSFSVLQEKKDLGIIQTTRMYFSLLKTYHTCKGNSQVVIEGNHEHRRLPHPNQWSSKRANLFLTLIRKEILSNRTVFVFLKLLRLIVTCFNEGRSTHEEKQQRQPFNVNSSTKRKAPISPAPIVSSSRASQSMSQRINKHTF